MRDPHAMNPTHNYGTRLMCSTGHSGGENKLKLTRWTEHRQALLMIIANSSVTIERAWQ